MRFLAGVFAGMVLFAGHTQAQDTPLTFNLPSGKASVQEELQDLFDRAASEKRDVVLPSGTFAFDDLLVLDGISVSGQGAETILQGTRQNQSALVMQGKGARLSHLTVQFEAKARSGYDESALVLVDQAKDFTITDVTMRGGDSAGIFAREAGPGVIKGNRIENTLADGIHITARSHDIKVLENAIRFTGDDGIGVVSYKKNRGLTYNIDIAGNRVFDVKKGRGIAVVGGAHVRVADNQVHCASGYAGILVASESAFQTYGTQNIAVTRNLVEGCGGAQTGHGAIMISRDNEDHEGLWVESNYVLASPFYAFVIEGEGNHSVIVKDNGFIRSREGAISFRGMQPEVIFSGNTNQVPEWAKPPRRR